MRDVTSYASKRAAYTLMKVSGGCVHTTVTGGDRRRLQMIVDARRGHAHEGVEECVHTTVTGGDHRRRRQEGILSARRGHAHEGVPRGQRGGVVATRARTGSCG